jgi:hypothetical protein
VQTNKCYNLWSGVFTFVSLWLKHSKICVSQKTGNESSISSFFSVPPLTQFISSCLKEYRVIHKSLRDFQPLRYSSRDGHAEGEYANRGRDTPSFCPTLQVLDMCTLGDAADVNPVIKFLRHALQRVSQEPCISRLSQYVLGPKAFRYVQYLLLLYIYAELV